FYSYSIPLFDIIKQTKVQLRLLYEIHVLATGMFSVELVHIALPNFLSFVYLYRRCFDQNQIESANV
ncbi:MAG TPA: hypothetical protein VN703_01655, partial [Candidatus Sulfopaludibacter sp.]|nr:hypothetical protein [Candidatus Sulfopaludibacter sp.]